MTSSLEQSLTIRELRPERYPLAATLVGFCLRHRDETPAEWKREDLDRTARGRSHLRWEAIAADDALVAYAAAWETRPHRFRFDLVVSPDQRGRGVGASLLPKVLAAVTDAGARTLQARADAADGRTLEFLRRRHFQEVHRMVTMRRPIGTGHHVALMPPTPGLEVHAADACARADPDFWPGLHAAHVRAAADWPDADPSGPSEPITVDQFQRFFQDRGVALDHVLVARVDGRYVGYTGMVVHPGAPRTARCGPTAVDPGYRGRGIATALKAAALAGAADAGVDLAESRSANPALWRVNTKLGFTMHDAEVRLIRRLTIARQPPDCR